MPVNVEIPLRADPGIIERLEDDLMQKAAAALNAASVESVVHGVFSLDDLETKQETDLMGRLGVGVGYMGCKPVVTHPNPAGQGVAMLEYMYVILFATPVDAVTTQRHTATKMLSILRQGIIGQAAVSKERTQRSWQFVQEKPEVEDSSNTVLYYTQVWRLLMPVTGN